MTYFLDILRANSVLVLFLTLGIGFFVGKLRFGNFSLGNVTSVLLIGVIVGQLDIELPGILKTVFFMLFLFSIGYSVGPDFFKSLRGSGAKQALFAVIMSLCCFGATLLMAYILNYSKGEAVGLFAGSQTCSSLLGVGADSISRLPIEAAQKTEELNIIPVCYAVTYIFGTLGTVILLGNLGPKLLGGLEKVKLQTAKLEKELNQDNTSNDPAKINALRKIEYRTYRVTGEWFDNPHTIAEAEIHLHSLGLEVFIDRVSRDGSILPPRFDEMVLKGDEIVVCGRVKYMIQLDTIIGPEIENSELLSYPLDRVEVIVAKKGIIGIPLAELRLKGFMHGIVVRDAVRDGKNIVIDGKTTFEKGDRLTVIGQAEYMKNDISRIGYEDRPSIKSDLMFVGLAIFIGGLFGALTLWIGNVPLCFGLSGGALLGGLIFGWLRSKRPTFGNVSPGALWILNNLGLNVFIAVVGLDAAPSFISGLKAVGPMLFLAGTLGTLIPLGIGLWMGHKIFKFNPAITLGCCCGTRTCTAALGAVQTTLGSNLPAISYTVTYAVSNILLVVWGLLTVLII